MDFRIFFAETMVPKILLPVSRPKQIGFEAGSRIFFLSEVFGFTPHVAKSERYSIFYYTIRILRPYG
jgi:hypothetical protein